MVLSAKIISKFVKPVNNIITSVRHYPFECSRSNLSSGRKNARKGSGTVVLAKIQTKSLSVLKSQETVSTHGVPQELQFCYGKLNIDWNPFYTYLRVTSPKQSSPGLHSNTQYSFIFNY